MGRYRWDRQRHLVTLTHGPRRFMWRLVSFVSFLLGRRVDVVVGRPRGDDLLRRQLGARHRLGRQAAGDAATAAGHRRRRRRGRHDRRRRCCCCRVTGRRKRRGGTRPRDGSDGGASRFFGRAGARRRLSGAHGVATPASACRRRRCAGRGRSGTRSVSRHPVAAHGRPAAGPATRSLRHAHSGRPLYQISLIIFLPNVFQVYIFILLSSITGARFEFYERIIELSCLYSSIKIVAWGFIPHSCFITRNSCLWSLRSLFMGFMAEFFYSTIL